MEIKDKSTVYISFKGTSPRLFKLFNEGGELYHFRKLDGKTNRIKFNVLHAGRYYGNVEFDTVKIAPLEKCNEESLPALPPFERNRVKDLKIVSNPALMNTPARIFTQTGVIEKGYYFNTWPKPVRLFFLLHEVGHLYYETEEYCDLFAFVNYLKMGYNRSMAFYSLSKVLKQNPRNRERVNSLMRAIQKTNSKPLNFA